MASFCSVTDHEWALKHLRVHDDEDLAALDAKLDCFTRDVGLRLSGAADLPSVVVAREEAFRYVFGRAA